MGLRPEMINAQSARRGEHMIFSTESAFRLYPSFLKVAKFQFLRLFRRVRQAIAFLHQVGSQGPEDGDKDYARLIEIALARTARRPDWSAASP